MHIVTLVAVSEKVPIVHTVCTLCVCETSTYNSREQLKVLPFVSSEWYKAMFAKVGVCTNESTWRSQVTRAVYWGKNIFCANHVIRK